jgi:hypothetical protein
MFPNVGMIDKIEVKTSPKPFQKFVIISSIIIVVAKVEIL